MGKALGPKGPLGEKLFGEDKAAKARLRNQQVIQDVQSKLVRDEELRAKRTRAARRRARVAAQQSTLG